MRGRGPPQGWHQARGRESASPRGSPPVPRCLIRALAGVSLLPQDFLSCGGKEREVRGGFRGPRARGGRREERQMEMGVGEGRAGVGCEAPRGGEKAPELQRQVSSRPGTPGPQRGQSSWGEQEAAGRCLWEANICQGR